MPRYALALTLVLAGAAAAFAQPRRPAPPETYDVQLRYRIRADQDERIRQFRALEAFLKDKGFDRDRKVDDDLDVFDPAAEIFTGKLPGKAGMELLAQPSVRTVILTPAGQKWPDDAKAPVQVRLHLAADRVGREQRIYHEQTVSRLNLLGFVEAPGYDHEGFTKVRGTVPAGALPRLLKDLRTLPGGWFAADTPKDRLPTPFKDSLPVRLVEVLPDFPAEAAPPAAAMAPPANTFADKLEPAVRAVVDDATKKAQPLVVEAILEEAAAATTTDLRGAIQRYVDGAQIEGVVGVVVTVRVKAAQDLDSVARSPLIRTVRLPRVAGETALAAGTGGFVKASRIGKLHAKGYRGEGVRAVIVASDFPDYAGVLPKGVALLDLTAEVSPSLTALPVIRPGGGTAAARAFLDAAPAATVMLVRVDPAAFHQMLTVARAVIGDTTFSEAQLGRLEEIGTRRDRIAVRRRLAAEEYRQAFADLRDEPEVVKRRKDAAEAFKALQADEATFKVVVEGFLALRDGLAKLKGTNVVVNTLAWEGGYPNDGLSELSRLLEAKFAVGYQASAIKAAKGPPPPLWVQAASTAFGRAWAGPFFDADGNGVMEFGGTAKLPAGRWTRELNFLRYSPAQGEATGVLPAGTRLVVSVQWREPHPPDAFLKRDPILPLTLRLLRQLDPEGKTNASDDFVEVARSGPTPARLLASEGAGVYEASFAVALPAEGAYALRVEGVPEPVGLGTSSAGIGLETRPRISVEMLDPAQVAAGTVGLETFSSPNAGGGIPGDSPAALSVGAAQGSLGGAGPGLPLKAKPEVLAATVGQGFTGTAVGAGSAGGLAACLLSMGRTPHDLPRVLGIAPGSELVIPQVWLNEVTPRPAASTPLPARR